jgi:hypothetical protein
VRRREEGGVTEIGGVAPSSLALFAGIDDRGFDEMLRIGREVSFGPGEVIFEAGDRADGMFLVLEGEARRRSADVVRSLLLEQLSGPFQFARRASTGCGLGSGSLGGQPVGCDGWRDQGGSPG